MCDVCQFVWQLCVYFTSSSPSIFVEAKVLKVGRVSQMKNILFLVRFWFPVILCILHSSISLAQLSPSETRILFQVRKLLEYPPALQGWNNWTNFCYLPPSPSVKVVCHNNHVTELTIVGNKDPPPRSAKPSSLKSVVSNQTLSATFSIDSFFTVLTKLSNLRLLSLVYLGMWGPLPAKISRLPELEVLNVSSNFIYGAIPSSISSLTNITSLVLADNMLNGSVPDLQKLTLLQELNLGNNYLGPEFPSIPNYIVSIILKENSLRSRIPSMIMHLDKLQQFDISSNKFVGPIPSSVFSLPSIQSLNLAQNQLSGALPANTTCGKGLKFVDLSNNLLIGKVPACIGSKSSIRTVLYSWNCLSSKSLKYQHPLSYCQKEALAVNPMKNQKNVNSGVNIGLILGIVGGIVALAAIIVVLFLVILRKSKAQGKYEASNYGGSVADKVSVRSTPRPNFNIRHVPQRMRSGAVGLPPYRSFTLEEIEDATNNFDHPNLLGEGSQGELYKGWIRNGPQVVVNCIRLDQKHSSQKLLHHIEVLAQLRHRHLVSILGHCVINYEEHPNTASTVFVVQEHFSNGTLRGLLTEQRRKTLNWPQRMAISIGIARGVQFLHTGVAPGIFGNNLNTENILMDESLNAKISGYKISLPSKNGNEDTQNGHPTHSIPEKEDIYQLGVILVQVISGEQITSANELEKLKIQMEKGLLESPSILRATTDPYIQGTYAYESLRTTCQITINCLSEDSNKRPPIEDVVWNLQYSMQVQEGWASSGNLGTKL